MPEKTCPPLDCQHIEIETLYQYDKQKKRFIFWACRECNLLFVPKGLAEAERDALAEQLQQAQAELAGMELMDAEGEAFGETIVRENERLKAELAEKTKSAEEYHTDAVGFAKKLQQAQEENRRLRNDAKRISRIEDHKTRHEQMDALIAGSKDVSP